MRVNMLVMIDEWRMLIMTAFVYDIRNAKRIADGR